jgi:hypothetical protein
MSAFDQCSDEVILHIFAYDAHRLARTCRRMHAIYITHVATCHASRAIAHYTKRKLIASAIILIPHIRMREVDYTDLLMLACKNGLTNLFRTIIATTHVSPQSCTVEMLDNAIYAGNLEIANYMFALGIMPLNMVPSGPQMIKMLITYPKVRLRVDFHDIFINSLLPEWFELVDDALKYPEVSIVAILKTIMSNPNFTHCIQRYKSRLTETEYENLIVWGKWSRDHVGTLGTLGWFPIITSCP